MNRIPKSFIFTIKINETQNWPSCPVWKNPLTIKYVSTKMCPIKFHQYHLDTKKATDPNELQNILLKSYPAKLSPILSESQKDLKFQRYPKKAEKNKAVNYHPISLVTKTNSLKVFKDWEENHLSTTTNIMSFPAQHFDISYPPIEI